MAESDPESDSSTSSSSPSEASSGEEATSTNNEKSVPTSTTSVNTEDDKRDQPLKVPSRCQSEKTRFKSKNKIKHEKKNLSCSESSSSSSSCDSDDKDSSTTSNEDGNKKRNKATIGKKLLFLEKDSRKRGPQSDSSTSSSSPSESSSGEDAKSTNNEKSVNTENKKRDQPLKDSSRRSCEKTHSKSKDKIMHKNKTLSSSKSSLSNSSDSDSDDRGSSTPSNGDGNKKKNKATTETKQEFLENDSRKMILVTGDVQQSKNSKDDIKEKSIQSCNENNCRLDNTTKYENVSEKRQKSPERDYTKSSKNNISELPREILQKSNDTDLIKEVREDSDNEPAKRMNIVGIEKRFEQEEQQSRSPQDPIDKTMALKNPIGNGTGIKQQSLDTENKEHSIDLPELKLSKSSYELDDNIETRKVPSETRNATTEQPVSNQTLETMADMPVESDSSKLINTKVIAQKDLKYDREEGELPDVKQHQKNDYVSGDLTETNSSQAGAQESRSTSKDQQRRSISPKPKKSSRSQSRSREPHRKPNSDFCLRSRSRDIEYKRRSGSRKRNYSRELHGINAPKSRSQSRSKEKQSDRRSQSRSHSRSRQTHRKQRSVSPSPKRSQSRENRKERKYDDRNRSHSSEYERRRSRRSESLERRREERKRRHAERDERDKSKRSKRDDEDVRSHKESTDNVETAEFGKEKNNDNVTVTDPKAKITERQRKTVDILTSRTGGAYIPPAKLRLMQSKITDKASAAYQRIAWEALKKSIHGYINKVNVDNIAIITRELLKENIVRGRGLLCRSIIQAQAASPTFTHVYAALVSIINSKFPNIGELLLKRLVIQFKRAFRRNDKAVCISSSRFVAHLVNQRVAHEILALEILTLLVESPTDDSVEVAIAFLRECGMKLTEVSSKGIGAIFEMLKNILHEGKLDKRVQYMIEVVFQVRKDGFKDHQSVIESLELVEEDDQFTHLLMLDDATNPEDILNAFKFDEEYEVNEDKYKGLSKEILGSDGSGSGDSSGSCSESGSGSSESDDDKDGDDEKAVAGDIIDNTETNLIALRRTIYLTINSSLDYEECAHKLMKMQLKPGQEIELCHMFLDCCAEQRTYEKFYGLLAQRFCHINKSYIEPFEEIFCDTYGTTHRLDTNRLRNVSKFFAHLLFTDAISWDVMECIRLNEDDTTSSSRIFIKILFQELAEYMGLSQLNKKLKDEVLADSLTGLFPKDNPRNSRFSINFFTSIGLGGLTDELRQFLKNAPKSVPAINAEILANKPINVSASSKSSSSSSSSSSSDTSSESSSSDSEEEKRKSKRKGKRQKTKKKATSKKSKKKSKKSNKKHKKSSKAETSENESTSSSSDSHSESSQSSTSSESGNKKRKSKKNNKLKQNKNFKRFDKSDDQKQSENEDLSKRSRLQNESGGFDVQRDDRRNKNTNIRFDRDIRKSPPPQRRKSEIERHREERDKRHREKEPVLQHDRRRTRSRSRDKRGVGGGYDRNRRDERSERNREHERDMNRRRYRNDDCKSRSRSRDRYEKRERDDERSRQRNTSKERG